MADWIKRGETLPQLANALGIPADNLVETVERFNRLAREGKDPDFHRGESTFDLQWGEFVFPGRGTASVLGPLDKPPFYAVRLGLTTAGNLGGLVTDSEAQVIDVRGRVIPGLYCTSNTQAMLPLGHHYDSGAAQGKSMIFGYIAARHMAQTAKK
jgi:3-oxosteroid 1-dehydrogenase